MCPDSSVISAKMMSRRKDFVVVVPWVALLHLLCDQDLFSRVIPAIL